MVNIWGLTWAEPNTSRPRGRTLPHLEQRFQFLHFQCCSALLCTYLLRVCLLAPPQLDLHNHTPLWTQHHHHLFLLALSPGHNNVTTDTTIDATAIIWQSAPTCTNWREVLQHCLHWQNDVADAWVAFGICLMLKTVRDSSGIVKCQINHFLAQRGWHARACRYVNPFPRWCWNFMLGCCVIFV